MIPRWSVSRRSLRPEERLLPLLQRYPEVWAVLQRHGVGARGAPGPADSIATFATSHHLDPALFRDECSAILRRCTATRGASEPLCRAYVGAGLTLTLLTGVLWTAWLLQRLGTGQPLGPPDLPAIQTHAELQVYGWVGLLCMGLSYTILPRVWRRNLVAPGMAGLILGLMLAALVLRAVVLMHGPGGPYSAVGNLASGLQVVAVSLFAAQLVATFRQAHTRVEPITGFLMVGLAWLLASSLLSALSTNLGLAAGDAASLSRLASRIREPLRDMQIHGLALVLTLGLALSLLPRYFDLPVAGERRAWWALDLMTTAVMAEIPLSMALEATGHAAFAVGLIVSWLMLATGAGLLVRAWRPWRSMPGAGVCGWFVRGAFAWLTLAMGLLVLQPAFAVLAGDRPDASHDAARHALAAGYLTLLLMGVTTRLAVAMGGHNPRSLPGLALAFWLANLAAGLRLLAILAGEGPGSLRLLLALSDASRLAALACWGLLLWRLGQPRAGVRPAVSS